MYVLCTQRPGKLFPLSLLLLHRRLTKHHFTGNHTLVLPNFKKTIHSPMHAPTVCHCPVRRAIVQPIPHDFHTVLAQWSLRLVGVCINAGFIRKKILVHIKHLLEWDPRWWGRTCIVVPPTKPRSTAVCCPVLLCTWYCHTFGCGDMLRSCCPWWSQKECRRRWKCPSLLNISKRTLERPRRTPTCIWAGFERGHRTLNLGVTTSRLHQQCRIGPTILRRHQTPNIHHNVAGYEWHLCTRATAADCRNSMDFYPLVPPFLVGQGRPTWS